MLAMALRAVRASDVATVGGKGANLGELIAAGFPVPDGFVLTTDAYVLGARAALVDPADPPAARERLRATPVPDAVADAAREAYRALGGGAVAVRSSATAEDLPGASFAGQQDTYLDVDGEDALLDAVRRCWASLWNERAVAYRAANRVDPRGVTIAVVVQRMVDASAAGVLFTADPVSGRRGRTVVEAHAGPGEAVVSGAVDPDRFVVDPRSGAVLERRPRSERAALSDSELGDLARTAARVVERFGADQDVEFALDPERRIWLVQSRPITTLYPLPADRPDPERDPRIYASVNVAQGYFAPLTPMGAQVFRLLGASVSAALGQPLADPAAGPPVIVEAGMRLFADVTGLARDRLGRDALRAMLGIAEVRTGTILEALFGDPRFALRERSRLHGLRRLVGGLFRLGIPAFALRAAVRPEASLARSFRDMDEAAARGLATSSASARLDSFEELFLTTLPYFLPRFVGNLGPAMLSYALAARLLGGRARPDELQTLLRGVEHDPTTEMDLALWALAKRVRDDALSRRALREVAPADLAAAYRRRMLPSPLQDGLAEFLGRYGHRAVGEIDIGVPRWSDDPAHVLGALANYLRITDEAQAPDARFARGRAGAEAMARTLLSRVRGPRRLVLRALLRRVRALMGGREAPKFYLVRLIARARELLLPVGRELAAKARLASADDVFFLTLPEARRALAGEDVRGLVAERRATFARELARRHVPRVLLSDGTDAETLGAAVAEGALRGTAASPGTVTAPARVILSPRGARLEPGEVLVAPSTDPGWTPLFLTAGGLVMEMGGMMSHGAVVAREYGIPAVVGVAGATERIADGQRVTVDGSAGTVAIAQTAP